MEYLIQIGLGLCVIGLVYFVLIYYLVCHSASHSFDLSSKFLAQTVISTKKKCNYIEYRIRMEKESINRIKEELKEVIRKHKGKI